MEQSKEGHLVVIGSSAGGIDALSHFVGTLKRDFPAPIVLAQHLDPKRPSQLASILERRTELPIVVVENQAMLAPGHIYVVPSGLDVLVDDGSLRVQPQPEREYARQQGIIDTLFSSAAQAYQDRTVAAILTGTGNDGAAGTIDVKRAGGTVIIQDPSTARFPYMPLAIPPTAVDHVCDLDRLGGLLVNLIRGAEVLNQKPADDALKRILQEAARQANIDFRAYKPTTILRRIARRMAINHCRDMDEYARLVESHPAEATELVMAFLIKVTEFFRDPEAFEVLRKEVLPKLLEQGRAQGKVLRIWSVGCSTGEEPFSLAMMIAELLESDFNTWTVKIFATDVDQTAIEYARRGAYPINLIEGLPESYRKRFFEKGEAGWRISKALRQMVIFGQQDLARGVPFPRIDLVVCRNVLIYFKPELQQYVLDLFSYSLHQGQGFLFLGKAETARPSKAAFEVINKRWRVYRCKEGAVTAPHRNAFPALQLSDRAPVAPGRNRVASEQARAAEENERQTLDLAALRRFNEIALRFLQSGIAIIDRSYRIITINSAARRLLGIVDVANDQDFLHASRALPYAELRSAIDSVSRERTPLTLPEMRLAVPSGDPRFISATITPMHHDGHGPELIVITFNEISEQVMMRQKMEAAQRRLEEVNSEVATANKKLSDLNKELQDSNEQLQAANEEMMLTQEELQATNEEFEATNEELQATNEELETNNEELQATNEELEATNEELSARSDELQSLASQLSTERLRLEEMVNLAPFSILMFRGPELSVAAVNLRFTKLIEAEVPLGAPIDELFPEATHAELVLAVREVQRNDEAKSLDFQFPVPAKTVGLRCWIVPTHDAAGKVDGVVVYAEEREAAVPKS